MSFVSIYLEKENGDKIGNFLDDKGIVEKIKKSMDLSLFCYWNFIDLYGDTIFNRLQMDKLKEESEDIKKQLKDKEVEKFIEGLIELIEKCKSQPHQYIRFVGD